MAQAILLKDVDTLGERGDVIDVSPGYLRNFLVPRKLAQPATAGDDGRLFGSVTSQEIVDAIRQARGVRLDKRRVQLEDAIRTTGTHMVTVEVADGVTTEIKTIVTPQA
jgi:large subunit ribosomal protein L9